MTGKNPLIAIIGRPNVGKSTLFNVLARGRRVITHDQPGVTRDRIYGTARFHGQNIDLIDTGGLVLDAPGRPGRVVEGEGDIEAQVFAQACQAVQEAGAIIVLVDGREGLTLLDSRLADFARQTGKPAVVAVNKSDTPASDERVLVDFHSLGLPLAPISSAHNRRLDELLGQVLDLMGSARPDQSQDGDTGELKPEGESQVGPGADEASRPLRLAMLGRPNVGKSSLINALLGRSRMIVSDVAGTTRDSVDAEFEADGRKFVFVDTAGVRRRSRVDQPVERFSVSAALDSAQRSDISLLVLDAIEGLTVQDKKLIAFLDKYKIAFITLVNKIDLLERSQRPKLMAEIRQALTFNSHAPILGVSARTRAGLPTILPTALELWEECGLRIGTGVLNRAARQVIEKHQPPAHNGRRAKFYYLTQAETRPPTFIFFVNDTERIKESYARYLENGLRSLFGLKQAPLRLLFRSSKGNKDA